jgi:hypothetical protein
MPAQQLLAHSSALTAAASRSTVFQVGVTLTAALAFFVAILLGMGAARQLRLRHRAKQHSVRAGVSLEEHAHAVGLDGDTARAAREVLELYLPELDWGYPICATDRIVMDLLIDPHDKLFIASEICARTGRDAPRALTTQIETVGDPVQLLCSLPDEAPQP